MIVLRKAAVYNVFAMGLLQKLIIKLLPKSWSDKIEKDSRAWRVNCDCGHSESLWNLGGMRGKHAGKSHWRRRCEKCGQRSWQVITQESDS